MAYTDPPTFVADDPLAADELNILSEDIADLDSRVEGTVFASVQLRRAATQSIPNSSDTEVAWDTENFDHGGWYSSGNAVVVPAAVIPDGDTSIGVDVVALVKFATDGTGKRKVTVLKNGSGFGNWKVAALDDDNTSIVYPDQVIVEEGDEITVEVWQNSGSSLNISEARLTVSRRGVAG